VDSGGSFTTAEAIVVIAAGIGGAFLGAIVGALLASGFELWRRGLDAQSAARIIRLETIENLAAVQVALEGLRPPELSNAAWIQHRLTLAPVLNRDDLAGLHHKYRFVNTAQQMLEQLGQSPDSNRTTLEHWSNDLKSEIAMLSTIERLRKGRLIWRLIFGPPTIPTSEDTTTQCELEGESTAQSDQASATTGPSNETAAP
jgi:hypothetical protein